MEGMSIDKVAHALRNRVFESLLVGSTVGCGDAVYVAGDMFSV
jgi:hypothetical protein